MVVTPRLTVPSGPTVVHCRFDDAAGNELADLPEYDEDPVRGRETPAEPVEYVRLELVNWLKNRRRTGPIAYIHPVELERAC